MSCLPNHPGLGVISSTCLVSPPGFQEEFGMYSHTACLLLSTKEYVLWGSKSDTESQAQSSSSQKGSHPPFLSLFWVVIICHLTMWFNNLGQKVKYMPNHQLFHSHWRPMKAFSLCRDMKFRLSLKMPYFPHLNGIEMQRSLICTYRTAKKENRVWAKTHENFRQA